MTKNLDTQIQGSRVARTARFDADLAEVLHSIPGRTPIELRDRALLELACGLGLRAKELVDLDVADVGPDAQEMRVPGNGSMARVVPAGEPAWQAIQRWLARGRPVLVALGEAGPGESALFVSKTGRRLSASDVRRRLRVATRRVAASAGGSPQALKQSFATRLLEGGAGQRSIQELLGRTTLSTTHTYTGVESDPLRRAYARSHPRA